MRLGHYPTLTATPGLDQAGRQIHQLLHDRSQPPTLRRVAHRRDRSREPEQTDPAQDVVGEAGQAQHQIIGVELARRQPLNVEISLELGVELLASRMPSYRAMMSRSGSASEVRVPTRSV